MPVAGGYQLAVALGRADETADDSLIVKTDAANAAQNIYLLITEYWTNRLENDAGENGHPAAKGNIFQADDAASNNACASANALTQTEEGIAAQIPQNIQNLLRSCTDIIGLFAFVAQLQSSQA